MTESARKLFVNLLYGLAFFRSLRYNHSCSCRCDGIGRRRGLKILRWRQRAGSSPATGTTPAVGNSWWIAHRFLILLSFILKMSPHLASANPILTSHPLSPLHEFVCTCFTLNFMNREKLHIIPSIADMRDSWFYQRLFGCLIQHRLLWPCFHQEPCFFLLFGLIMLYLGF